MGDCRLCLWCIVALLMAAVYTICLILTKSEFAVEASVSGTELYQQPTENGLFLVNIINTRRTRIIRAGLISGNLRIVELYELHEKISEQVFNMTVFLKVNWIDDFRNHSSKAFKVLECLLVNGIEDLFDKKLYDQNKLISILAKEMKRVKNGGVMVKTEVTTLNGKVEIDELQMAIEEGAQGLFKEISENLAAGFCDEIDSAEMTNSTSVWM